MVSMIVLQSEGAAFLEKASFGCELFSSTAFSIVRYRPSSVSSAWKSQTKMLSSAWFQSFLTQSENSLVRLPSSGFVPDSTRAAGVHTMKRVSGNWCIFSLRALY